MMLLDFALKAVAVIAVAILLLTAFLYVTQRGSLYFPWPEALTDAPPGVEPIELHTDDGLALGAWFVAAAGLSLIHI